MLVKFADSVLKKETVCFTEFLIHLSKLNGKQVQFFSKVSVCKLVYLKWPVLWIHFHIYYNKWLVSTECKVAFQDLMYVQNNQFITNTTDIRFLSCIYMIVHIQICQMWSWKCLRHSDNWVAESQWMDGSLTTSIQQHVNFLPRNNRIKSQTICMKIDSVWLTTTL